MRKLALLFLVSVVVLASLVLGGCGGDKKDVGQAVQPAKQDSVVDLLGKGKQITGMSFDYIVNADTKVNGNESQTAISGKMWVEGKKMRTEAVMENQKMVTIINGDANTAYTYWPDSKTAMKWPMDKAKAVESPDRYAGSVDATNAKVLETATYDGANCKVLMIQKADGKGETKMWVREDYGIPVRIENNDSGISTVIEYNNLQVGPVPAEMFQLPAGVQVLTQAGLQ